MTEKTNNSQQTLEIVKDASDGDLWNEDEGVLNLVEFKPQMPVTVSNGVIAARDPGKRDELKKIFLSVLRSTGIVVDAAKICQVPKSLAYVWRQEDPEFCYKWDKIIESEMLPHLEAEAMRRAMNGSDLLLMFMMKAIRRDKYDDKVAEKIVSQPSLTIQMLDVDGTLLGRANNLGTMVSVPAVKYIDGEILDGQKTLDSTHKDSEDVASDSTHEPSTGAKGTSTE